MQQHGCKFVVATANAAAWLLTRSIKLSLSLSPFSSQYFNVLCATLKLRRAWGMGLHTKRSLLIIMLVSTEVHH